jgi:hypothetical protein
MKTFIFICIGFLAFSAQVFAGGDMDRICEDSKIDWAYNNLSIRVTYPEPYVLDRVEKIFTSAWDYTLYYVLNVQSSGSAVIKRSELYSYNCSSKKPRLLLSMPVNKSCEYYSINLLDYDQDDIQNIILRRYSCGAVDGITEEVTVFNLRANKKIFTVWFPNETWPDASITGFVSWKTAWYLYFPYSGARSDSIGAELYQVDKKTKKLTKL